MSRDKRSLHLRRLTTDGHFLNFRPIGIFMFFLFFLSCKEKEIVAFASFFFSGEWKKKLTNRKNLQHLHHARVLPSLPLSQKKSTTNLCRKRKEIM